MISSRGGGDGAVARFMSIFGGGGGFAGLGSGFRSGFARVVGGGCEPPFFSCRAFSRSCSAGFVVACVPVGFPDVVAPFSSLRLVVGGGVCLAALGLAAAPAPWPPGCDVDVPSFVLFGINPPGPVVPDAPPLLASPPLPV